MKKYLFLILVVLSVSTFAEARIFNELDVTVFGGVNLDGKTKIKGYFSDDNTTEIFNRKSKEIGYTIGIEVHKQVAKISDIDFKLGLGTKYETGTIFEDYAEETFASTLPLYGSAKLSVPFINEASIYLQGTLGHVFAFKGKFIKEFEKESKNNRAELKGGLYSGIGVGMETERYNLGLTYNITNYKTKLIDPLDYQEIEFKYSKLTLTVGYKI